MVGKWSATTKMWWEGPDGPATETKGSAVITRILNGRFLRQEWTGEHDKPVKYVSRTIDTDTIAFEIIDLAVSDDYKVVEITYKRM